MTVIAGGEKTGWLGRLRTGLNRSASKLSEGLSGLFTGKRAPAETIQELEELLIAADLGPVVAAKLASDVAKIRFDRDSAEQEVRQTLARDITALLEPVAKPLVIDPKLKPHVVLIAGVNGTGKTTTIGKLAKFYGNQNLRVILAAGDTFRAAAIEQLKIWGMRTNATVIASEPNSDAAALAHDAFVQAQELEADLLMIDTAGRLHNKADLMAELQKVARVLKKIDPAAPHSVVLVLDATTGQNAINQVETFRSMIDLTGLIVTKLDGSARGGVLVALAEKFKLPVHAIGVGEGVDDLRPFDANQFARALLGFES